MKFKFGKKKAEINIDGLSVTKKVISTVAAYGAGVIIVAIIQKHLPEGMKIHTRVAVALGAWAIANMTKEQVSAYTDKTFDETHEFFTELKGSVKVLREELAEHRAKAA